MRIDRYLFENGFAKSRTRAAAMIEAQLRVQDAKQIIFPHPTVSEIIRETIWEFKD